MSRTKPFSLVTPGDGNPERLANGRLPCGCSHDPRELSRIQAENRRNPSEGPWPAAERDVRLSRAVNQYLRTCCGEWQGVVHEKRSWLVHLEVFVYGPTAAHPYVDFFTAGMSQLPMNDRHARHKGLPDRAELMLQLPASWAGGKPILPQFDDAGMLWPALLLQMLARLPHERRTCLRHGAIVTWDEGAYAGLPFVGAMTVISAWCGNEVVSMIRPNCPDVDILRVIPLHASEIAFARDHGPSALQDELLAAGVDATVLLDRAPVV